MVTARLNYKISRFRCDGRAYMSNEIKEYFEEKGVQFKFTIRYTPQQNGAAERVNRIVIEKARCMILGSKLGKEFWSEAVLTVYLDSLHSLQLCINESPTPAITEVVPAYLWFNEPVNTKKLKVLDALPIYTYRKNL